MADVQVLSKLVEDGITRVISKRRDTILFESYTVTEGQDVMEAVDYCCYQISYNNFGHLDVLKNSDANGTIQLEPSTGNVIRLLVS